MAAAPGPCLRDCLHEDRRAFAGPREAARDVCLVRGTCGQSGRRGPRFARRRVLAALEARAGEVDGGRIGLAVRIAAPLRLRDRVAQARGSGRVVDGELRPAESEGRDQRIDAGRPVGGRKLVRAPRRRVGRIRLAAIEPERGEVER